MRFRQNITLSPWPLKIIYFVLAGYLALGLIAGLVWLEFGRDAEGQVVEFGLEFTTVVGIVLFPILLIGLIVAPFYRWIAGKLAGFIDNLDRSQ